MEAAQSARFNVDLKGDGAKSKMTGPNEEQISAFILAFRFFIQDNERTSPRSLAANELNDAGISQAWKKAFKSVRKDLNSSKV